MGKYDVDTTTEPGVLRLRLEGAFTEDEMRAFAREHNRAIDGYRGSEYRVWCDVTALKPLNSECAAIFEKAKRYSAEHPNFMGSAVLVSSAIVGMQHRRTSIDGGVMETELISSDEAELREHLRRVRREPPRRR